MTRPQAMQTARDMWAGGEGWKITEIRDYLAERGHDMCWETIRAWADPEWKQRERDRMRPLQRRRKRAQSGSLTFRIQDDDAVQRLREALAMAPAPKPELTPELLLELRVEDGLSYRAIAAVTRRLFDANFSPEQVRWQLHKLGVPKNESKARAMSAYNRDRKAAA